ncbi:hypothetical protein BZA05DRAFT_411607 [Tricharina praecox]|uniref:uncharacterized protein n=1 Tax=Tricharina praecox TaxID=43433 RepID=UPI00221EDC67|nr:uncharacterized protein BZA05DRAFT_411607 [Tricharina praecox]KAI5842837.1 hypothetical protein BZA05DRAFT_411607 [Tricharina praecox]
MLPCACSSLLYSRYSVVLYSVVLYSVVLCSAVLCHGRFFSFLLVVWTLDWAETGASAFVCDSVYYIVCMQVLYAGWLSGYRRDPEDLCMYHSQVFMCVFTVCMNLWGREGE